MDIGCRAYKANGHPVGMLRQSEIDIDAIFLGHGRNGQFCVREVHSFAILQDAANNHSRSYGRLGRVDHLQFEQAVIQQNALPHFACHVRLGCPAASFDAGRHFLILNRHPSRLADNIIGGEYQLFTGTQRTPPCCILPTRNFGPCRSMRIATGRFRTCAISRIVWMLRA